MKLKEMPPSLSHTLKLLSYGTNRLKNPASTLPVIVTLTTIPYRLKKVHITIRSVLAQSTPPKKLILWLHEDLKNQVPNSLKKLEGEIFSIAFSKISCPHLKLVESLKKYPKDMLVVCDDDMIYPENWLKSIYQTHINHPGAIIANYVRQIRYDENHHLMPYKNWYYNTGEPDKMVPLGVGGVLYPPGSLNPMATNEKVFLELCPKADDLWFKAMAILNNTPVKKLENSIALLPIMFTQKVSLKKQNIGKDMNVEQWKKLVKHFNIKLT